MSIINREIINNFLKFESDHLPQDILYKNQAIWPSIRYAIFYYLLGDEYKGIDKNKRISLIKLLKSIVITFSLRGYFGQADILVFDYAKERMYEDEQINPLVFTVLKTLGKKYKITIISEKYSPNYFKNNKDVKSINIFLLKKITNIFLTLLVNKRSLQNFKNKLGKSIETFFNKKIDLDRVYKNIFLNQRAGMLILKIIFYLKKPKIIIYSDNANMSEIIRLAKKKDILTIDYQHSLLSDLNILYIHNNLLNKSYKEYLSDHIFIFGDYWKKFYSKHYKTIIVGNYIHDYTKALFCDVKQDDHYITIISSIISRDILIEAAISIAVRFPEKKIVFKLKPMEFNNWKNTALLNLENYKNIEIIDHDRENIEFYIKKSKFVIGTNSTALIEAMPYSNVIVMKHGWYKEMQYFIENGYFLLASDTEELRTIVGNKNQFLRKFPINEIFKEESSYLIRTKINELLN